MSNVGRPSKFSPDVCLIILEKIEGGNFLAVAARYAGVSYKTFKEWMNRGRSDAPEDAEFRAFRAAVRRARAKAEADAVERITKANTWSADAWLLERSFRQRWGKRDHLTVKAENVDVTKLSDAELEAIANGKGQGGA